MPWKPPPMPKCARCEKSVYPTEELKCLDKLWHQACFNCEVCHVKLTMKTYRGFDKKPYCQTHYPTTKATQVADTPESMRLKQQTERQSVVKYHQQYNENKGHYVGSATDVNTASAQRSAALASNVKYKSAPEGPTKAPAVKAPTPMATPQVSAPPQPEPEPEPEPVRQPEPEPEPEPEPAQTSSSSLPPPWERAPNWREYKGKDLGGRCKIRVYSSSTTSSAAFRKHNEEMMRLFERMGVHKRPDFEPWIMVDLMDKADRDAVFEKAGTRQLPMLFVDDEYVGGYEEVMDLNESNQLEKVVNY
eukprot:m.64049 g.64049  ORF g.64049 m.64049 type:complete len:304 (-) comp13474_c2_seq4:273-1184(-)